MIFYQMDIQEDENKNVLAEITNDEVKTANNINIRLTPSY